MTARDIDPADLSITEMERHPPAIDPPRGKAYEHELARLQIEMLKMQLWAKETNARVLMIFEGRDAAGKGGAIRRFTEHTNPRGARVVALPKPTEAELTQWYFQRYVTHLPSGGEIVFFDRSWYNRAGVEAVMGYATKDQRELFYAQLPAFEQHLVDSGIHLFKLWFTVSKQEQKRRFDGRRGDPLKQWKLSPNDELAVKKFAQYGAARDEMLRRTDTRARAVDRDQLEREEVGEARVDASRPPRVAVLTQGPRRGSRPGAPRRAARVHAGCSSSSVIDYWGACANSSISTNSSACSMRTSANRAHASRPRGVSWITTARRSPGMTP